MKDWKRRFIRFSAIHCTGLLILVILLAELILVLLTGICLTIGMIPNNAAYFIIGAILAGDLAGVFFWFFD